jgi:thiol-disulfide isomerase/thioredoxin
MPAKMIPNDNVDVRVGSAAALKQLKELLKKNKIVLVLIYADWCGHCQTFKKGEWSALQAEPGRKIPMAQIQAEALDQTPLADTPVDGYPYVGVVGQDRRMANIENPRDMRTMRAVVNADPEVVLNGGPGAAATNNNPEEDEDEEDEEGNENEPGEGEYNVGANNNNSMNEPGTVSEPTNAEAQANEFTKSLNTMIPGTADLAAATAGPRPSATMNRVAAGPSATAATPPDLAADIATSATPGNSFTGKRVNFGSGSATASGPLMGGSLFATLKGIAKNGVKIASTAASAVVTKGGARKTRRGGAKPRRFTARKLRR